MQRLLDRVAVVTGAGSGIGLASARRMASEGAKIAVVDIGEHDAGTLVREPPSCRKADPAAAAGDDCGPAFESPLWHVLIPPC